MVLILDGNSGIGGNIYGNMEGEEQSWLIDLLEAFHQI